MPDLINLWAASERDIVSDDATPTLTLKNTNTTTGRALDLIATGLTAQKASSLGAGPVYDIHVSSASGTVLKVNNIEQGFVSTNSTASLAFAMRVEVSGSANTIYYVPVYTGS